jgi:hypothetical protein
MEQWIFPAGKTVFLLRQCASESAVFHTSVIAGLTRHLLLNTEDAETGSA